VAEARPEILTFRWSTAYSGRASRGGESDRANRIGGDFVDIQNNGTAAWRAGSPNAKARQKWHVGVAATLLISCSPAALHAETSNDAVVAKEIAELKAQIRELRGVVAAQGVATKRAVKQVKVIASKSGGYALPSPSYPPLPTGAVPAFITVDKKLQFGALTITPGGFVAGESVFRSRTTNSDINSAWGSIPLNNSPLAHTNEERLTGRQSRAALLVEGAITPSVLVSGYGEFDFLGAGTTSNATDTNSYAPRIRQLYAGLDMDDYGLHLLAGQMWSLTTLNSKGITPRNEVTPPTIDGQFLPGFIFARQAAVRLTKDFGRKLWLSLALEEAQTTFPGGITGACQGGSLSGTTNGVGEGNSAAPIGVTTPAGITAICAATASGAGFSQYGQPYSLNHLPDVIGKVAYEAKVGDRDIHLEGTGLYKDLYNATYQANGLGVNPSALSALNGISRNDVAGYGVGAGIIAPILPKRLDFQIQAMTGRGIGRYGAGLLPDSTLNVNGTPKAIGETIGLAGFTVHATPALDVYAFGGIERENRAYSSFNPGTGVITNYGYGAPDTSNFGCNITNAPAASCSGQTQELWELTGGFWDKLYKGSFGEVRVGAQYAYTRRDVFGTTATATAAATAPAITGQTVAQASGFFSPKTSESTVMTSVRYYPFQ
jgi:hypothetical protein